MKPCTILGMEKVPFRSTFWVRLVEYELNQDTDNKECFTVSKAFYHDHAGVKAIIPCHAEYRLLNKSNIYQLKKKYGNPIEIYKISLNTDAL